MDPTDLFILNIGTLYYIPVAPPPQADGLDYENCVNEDWIEFIELVRGDRRFASTPLDFIVVKIPRFENGQERTRANIGNRLDRIWSRLLEEELAVGERPVVKKGTSPFKIPLMEISSAYQMYE